MFFTAARGAVRQGPLAAREAPLERLLLGVAQDVEPDGHLGDPLQRAHGLLDRLLEVGAHRAPGSGQRDHDVDAPALDRLDRADHA